MTTIDGAKTSPAAVDLEALAAWLAADPQRVAAFNAMRVTVEHGGSEADEWGRAFEAAAIPASRAAASAGVGEEDESMVDALDENAREYVRTLDNEWTTVANMQSAADDVQAARTALLARLSSLRESARIATENAAAVDECWRIALGMMGLAEDCGEAWRERLASLAASEAAREALVRERDTARDATHNECSLRVQASDAAYSLLMERDELRKREQWYIAKLESGGPGLDGYRELGQRVAAAESARDAALASTSAQVAAAVAAGDVLVSEVDVFCTWLGLRPPSIERALLDAASAFRAFASPPMPRVDAADWRLAAEMRADLADITTTLDGLREKYNITPPPPRGEGV